MHTSVASQGDMGKAYHFSYGCATVSSCQEARASVFGAIVEATGTLTGDGKPLHVQNWLSAECFVTLRVREGKLDTGRNCPLFYDLYQ
jgi:hypothetical protein